MSYPLLLHAKHRGIDVTYQPFGSWIVPWSFGATEEEYQVLRTGVGLIDYSNQALIEVQGVDRIDFLHRLLTNDIKQLSPGTGCQAALLTDTAKFVSDLLVLADETSHWLLCEATRAAAVCQTLSRYAFTEQVTIANHERSQAVLALQGPKTVALLTQLLGTVISLPNPGDHLLKSFHHIPIRFIRSSITGSVGVLCLAPVEDAAHLWMLLQQHGGPLGLHLVGWEALNTARIEAGIPWFGIDMTEVNLLPETGLETVAVSDTKGCYLGQEIIARLQTYGSTNKKLMGFLVEGEQIPEVGNPVLHEESEAGQITSTCYSPSFKRPLAMGYVKRGAYEVGTRVEILHGRTRLTATVTTRPFLSPT